MIALLAGMLAGCGGGTGTSGGETTTTTAQATQAPTEATTTAQPQTEAATAAPPAEEIISELPRGETLYFAGQQWGTVNNWNPYSTNSNNGMVFNNNSASPRETMFESLYMYNVLDSSLNPLLASGAPAWNDAHTELTVKINPAAHWNDGSPLTADDVAYSWTARKNHNLPFYMIFSPYVESVTATDPQTVVIKAVLTDAGTAANPLALLDFLCKSYIAQKAWTETLEARSADDEAFMNDASLDTVSSGPYKRYYADDQKVVLIRDDNYWGADASMWGKLPVPKYLTHAIYADNPAGQAALAAGEVDVCQQFIVNVQDLWLKDKLPISTWMDQPPYGLSVTMPSAFYNLNNPDLQNVAIRKAIAMAVDYDQINQNAMTGQSPTFMAVPRSLMNPTEGEQILYDQAAVKDLQWVGKDIEGANRLLDEAGIVDTDGDGIREFNGHNLKFNAVCPNGWTDWTASMEIVAAAGQAIGIDITTFFPEWDVYQTVFTDGNQTQYDIFMWGGDGTGPTYPWLRVRQRMSSEYIGTTNNWNGNWGGYSNPEADKIIADIPQTTDPAQLKAMYTRAVEIYLTDVPSFVLMYRPELFYAVNETYWTGYPAADDGRNIPPMDATDGYGIAGLYGLSPIK